MRTIAIILAAMATTASARGAPGDRAEPLAPDGNPGSWATNDDYPPAALIEEREGISEFRLTIDSTGTPTHCDIVRSSGHADLDEATCRLTMARARFRPGKDARGRTVGGTYTNRIRWQIPAGHDHFPDAGGIGLGSLLEGWPRPALPTPEMADLTPADHYPAAALADRKEGVVRMSLTVSDGGSVTKCVVTSGSGSDVLDNAACALMQSKAKFLPALDGFGKPTTGVTVLKYQWKLPESVIPDEAALAGALDKLPRNRAVTFPMNKPGSALFSIVINVDGSVSDCRFEEKGEIERSAISLCDVFGGKQVYAPMRDADGNPVARRVMLRTDLTIEDVAEEAGKGGEP